MPEGPEVQTIANGLRALIVGLTFTGATFFGDAVKMVEPVSADALGGLIAGQRVTGVGRRGKFIDIALDSGLRLFIHLMMTGRLVFRDAAHPNERPRFLRCVFTFEGGAELCIGDQRKWARIVCLPAGQIEAHPHFRALGVDVLTDEFTFARFRSLLTSRRPLHTFLLDQSRLSGLGNIYVNEALYQAGLHPLRRAGALTDNEAMALYHAIRHVVREAVRQLGTSFADYWMPDGTPGEFQNFLHVFRRKGEPCLRCGALIERIGMGGRGAFFCPNDQPLEPGQAAPPPVVRAPGAPRLNHVFILDDPVRARHIADHVPFLRLVETPDAALRAGSDVLISAPAGDAAALIARYPDAHLIDLGGAENSPDALLHAALDFIYGVRCRTPFPRL